MFVQRTAIMLAVATCLAWSGIAQATITKDAKIKGDGGYTTYRVAQFATEYDELIDVSSNDLINGFGVNDDEHCAGTNGCTVGLPINQGINESAIAPFALGWIDPYNGPTPPSPALPGVGSWYMGSGTGSCRQIYYEQPSSGFYEGLPGNGGMADLVDGVPGNYLKSVLRDYGRASLVVRYGFEDPTDIGRIRIFAANLDIGPTNPGRMSRIFQYYDVYARQGDCSVNCPAGPTWDDGFDEFFPVAIGVTTGDPGVGRWSNNPLDNPDPWEGTMTDVVNFNSDTLIEECTDLRIVLYCGGNTQGFFIDPWQGYWSDPAMGDVCSNSFPPEPEDTDGYLQAFEAPIIKEIDVFGPTDTPFGDIDYDGDRDLIDFAAFQFCFDGDVTTNGCYRFDYAPADADVDLDDLSGFVAHFNGP